LTTAGNVSLNGTVNSSVASSHGTYFTINSNLNSSGNISVYGSTNTGHGVHFSGNSSLNSTGAATTTDIAGYTAGAGGANAYGTTFRYDSNLNSSGTGNVSV
jgi:hypothetical protein